MIILSLNVHGFGGPHKIASIKALFSQVNPDIIFLQETLVNNDKAIKLFLQCVPSWNVVAVDPCGRSGGLLSGWNPANVELTSLDTLAGIYLEGRTKQTTGSNQIVELLCSL
jgi:exonuclease III